MPAKNSPKAGAKAAAKATPVVEERRLYARPWAVGSLPTGASLTGALPSETHLVTVWDGSKPY